MLIVEKILNLPNYKGKKCHYNHCTDNKQCYTVYYRFSVF